ncbi:electron transfer flavoprotein beta subunit [Saccharopolyspora erythraea NRRL 2338]|uniref:SDR family NAD(P)-dependent oxidoreductase n=1 Tax=Saccharopolyspora erythraea TaxID=1836 RepID=UPI0006624E5C|nr:SDR family NAD(P)-dependent oxidoreductase [Saccharopolyspora erythraea]PFG95452.1 electron transfer flavoprotein beta subunit [Saccharopolyspora erythraea NRRL 2338]
MGCDEPWGKPRVAVVTGAASGIGAATVRRLSSAGWRVVAVDRCADDNRVSYPLATREELAALVEEFPGAVADVVADVQDRTTLADAVAVAEYRFGGVDAAVAAAAVMAGGQMLWEEDHDEWHALFPVCVDEVANLGKVRCTCPDRVRRPGPGTVPAFLAAEFGAVQAFGVVRGQEGGGELLVHRRLDHGRREALRLATPAVVSVEAAGVRPRRAALPEVRAARRREIAVVDAPSADEAPARVLSRDPLRPRTHALAPPAGTRPRERLAQLTGASTSAPARVVGRMPASEAVDELGYLRERACHPEGSRP